MNWVDIDEAVQKKKDNVYHLFIHKPTFRRLSSPSSGFWKVFKGNPMRHSPLSSLSVAVTIIVYYSSAENEIRYIIGIATEREDRGMSQEFPSLTFQNPEERGNSFRNAGLWIKIWYKSSFFFLAASSISTLFIKHILN